MSPFLSLSLSLNTSKDPLLRLPLGCLRHILRIYEQDLNFGALAALSGQKNISPLAHSSSLLRTGAPFTLQTKISRSMEARELRQAASYAFGPFSGRLLVQHSHHRLHFRSQQQPQRSLHLHRSIISLTSGISICQVERFLWLVMGYRQVFSLANSVSSKATRSNGSLR